MRRGTKLEGLKVYIQCHELYRLAIIIRGPYAHLQSIDLGMSNPTRRIPALFQPGGGGPINSQSKSPYHSSYTVSNPIISHHRGNL